MRWFKRTSNGRLSRGQGFAEYAILIMFVGVTAFLSITILEPSVAGVFSRFVRQAPVAPPSLAGYTPPPTWTPGPSVPTSTPLPSGGGGGTGSGGSNPVATATQTAVPPTMTATARPGITPTATAVPIIGCGLTVEAENGTLSGDMRIGNSSNASGGRFVQVQNGEGDNWGGPNNDSVTLSFTITHADTYVIAGYVNGPNGNADSFWVDVNGSPNGGYLWDVDGNGSFPPDAVSDRNGDDPVQVYLAAGTHNIRFSLREDGTQLDKVELQCQNPPAENAPPPVPNLCLGATATQSSTANGAVAGRACDGDTNGLFSYGSVAQTNNESNPYWQVDLGRVYLLQQIKIFNRTDCCLSELSNFYVLVSNDPFTSPDLNTARAQFGVDEFYFAGNVDQLAFALAPHSGRYIRIQLADRGTLNLAEVEIYGSTRVPDTCTAVIDMFYIIDRSGSMNYSISGANNRMAASIAAIRAVNNDMIASGLDHRAGAVTFTGIGSYNSGGFTRVNVVNNTYPLSTNISSFNSTVGTFSPGGYTPTGPALEDARRTVLDTWDPLRVPIIILITDGAPNVPRDEILHSASEASNIDVYDNRGNPYELSRIASFGSKVQGSNSLRQGNILVDVLSTAETLMRSLPGATLYTIGLGDPGSREFNPELLTRVAEIGNGSYYAATSAESLETALQEIYGSVSCGDDS